MHWNAGATTLLDASVRKAKSVMIQRSSNVSYNTTGSPKFSVSHRLPKLPWPMNVSNVKAASRKPSLLRKMPIDVLTVWI